MSEMFSQGEIDRIIEDSWHEWQEEESYDVYDEYGNYKYTGDVELTEPNTATSMPCNDTISRQAAIDVINRLSIHNFAYAVKTGWVVRDDAVDELRQLPFVTPKQRTGHWIILSPTDMYCSECHEIEHLDTSRRFCAYCGTMMVEPQESEVQA